MTKGILKVLISRKKYITNLSIRNLIWREFWFAFLIFFSAFQFVKRDDADEVDLDKAEVILKSALVTDDQSSSEDEEDTEPQLAPVAVAELQQEQFSEPPPPVVNFDFEQQVQPADNRLNALDYPEDSGNADSSAPSSLESQSGPASVIVESQEVPTPDSAAFILKTSECPNSLDNLPTPQEAVVEVIPCSEVAQSPILEERCVFFYML